MYDQKDYEPESHEHKKNDSYAEKRMPTDSFMGHQNRANIETCAEY